MQKNWKILSIFEKFKKTEKWKWVGQVRCAKPRLCAAMAGT